MPRLKTDYSKTVIYKIVCNDLEIKDLYVGHTTDFTKRKNSHKTKCNNVKQKSYNYKVYKTIREHGNWSNWSMIEIEKFPCKDGNEARARERYFYEELDATLNTDVPNRSQKEYDTTVDSRQDRRLYFKEYQRERRAKKRAESQ